jgi:hypothetical protein
VRNSSADASGKRTACAVSGSISRSGAAIITVDTAHAAEAITAVHTPNHRRSGRASFPERTATMGGFGRHPVFCQAQGEGERQDLQWCVTRLDPPA